MNLLQLVVGVSAIRGGTVATAQETGARERPAQEGGRRASVGARGPKRGPRKKGERGRAEDNGQRTGGPWCIGTAGLPSGRRVALELPLPGAGIRLVAALQAEIVFSAQQHRRDGYWRIMAVLRR